MTYLMKIITHGDFDPTMDVIRHIQELHQGLIPFIYGYVGNLQELLAISTHIS